MRKNSIKCKTALVTGAVKRIGREIALCLARAGINVIVHYNGSTDKEADKLLDELSGFNINAIKIKADFSRLDETKKVFKKLKKSGVNPDILINNASIFKKSRIDTLGEKELSDTLNINSLSPLILSRDFAKFIKKGLIINILDTNMERYNANYAAYSLSKTLLRYITETTAISMAPDIRVNGIAPGIILPPFGEPKRNLKKLAHRNLLLRKGSIKNITETVLFIINNDFLTGEIIFVDGGEHLK